MEILKNELIPGLSIPTTGFPNFVYYWPILGIILGLFLHGEVSVMKCPNYFQCIKVNTSHFLFHLFQSNPDISSQKLKENDILSLTAFGLFVDFVCSSLCDSISQCSSSEYHGFAPIVEVTVAVPRPNFFGYPYFIGTTNQASSSRH